MRTNRFFTVAIALALTPFLGCDDGGGLGEIKGKLEAPDIIDFGDVQVGIAMPFALMVKNAGTGVLTVNKIVPGPDFSGNNYEFRINGAGFSIQPSETQEVTVTFQPFEAMENPVDSTITLELNLFDDNNNRIDAVIPVRGRGTNSGLEVSPNPVDFGKVLVGSSRTLEVTLTNRLNVPIDLTTMVGAAGEISSQGGLGRFSLVEAQNGLPNNSLLDSGMQLEPEASITVNLRYVPDPAQDDREDRGRWLVSNCDNALCETDITLIGRGTNAAIECEPAEIDFLQVNPGIVSTQRTVCQNVATEAVTVLGWEAARGTAPEYSVVEYTGIPANLLPNETFEVEVQFAPTVQSVGTDPAGSIRIRGRNPAANRDLDDVQVNLKGEAGGPDISVLPEQLNFGRIAVSTTGKKRILVENLGYNDLTVSQIDGDVEGTGLFAVDRQSFVVPPGGAEVIEVTFEPNATGQFASSVRIISDDSDEGEVIVPLTAEGISLPPCSYTVVPLDVNFGIVQVLRTTTQGVRITNTGPNDCLVNDIEIAPGSSEAFGLVNGNETDILIPPGGEKSVIIEYTPRGPAADSGLLTFYISDPINSNPEITVSGVGSESALLISPNEIDFGKIGVNCSTRQREITVYNTGSGPTTIDRIELPTGVSTEFKLENIPAGVPSPPGGGVTIAPGASFMFTVRYQATDLGVDNGFFHLFERGQTDPYVVPLFGEGAAEPINEDEFAQLETPEVDILFVIDNSCTMSEEQTDLAANFSSFIQFADAQALDYRIAVVTTDVDGCPSPAPGDRPPGIDQGQCGYFADGSGDGSQTDSAWRLITPDEQPSPTQAFSAISAQGINGSGGERGLEGAYRALSSPLITNWNSGFLRPDAYLALVFVSDEEDQSPNPVDFYTNFFLAIKGFRNSNLFSASAIVGPDPNECGFNADPGTRYLSVAERTGGITESICTSNWSRALENLGLSVFGYKSRFFLSNQPVPGTVEVFVDGVQVNMTSMSGQVRWSYDAPTNTVNFAPLAIPEPGSQIVVRYEAECL